MSIKYVSNPEKYKIYWPKTNPQQAEMYCNYCHSWAELNNQNCHHIVLFERDQYGILIFPEQYYYDAGFCMRATCNEKRAAKKKRDDERFYKQEAYFIAQEKAAEDRCDEFKKKLIVAQTSRKENEDPFPSFTEYKKKKSEEQKLIELQLDLYDNISNFTDKVDVNKSTLSLDLLNIDIPEKEKDNSYEPFPCSNCQEIGCFCGICEDCGEITFVADLITFDDCCQDCYNKNRCDHNNDDDIPQEKRYNSDFYDSD
jgi:hypothetical protein